MLDLLICLAVRADTVEVEAVSGNLIAGLRSQFLGKVGRSDEGCVADAMALGADEVDVWGGVAGVVVRVAIAKADFCDFAHIFQQAQGLVHRRQTHGGETRLEPLIELRRAEMLVAVDKHVQQSQPLRCDAAILLT